MSTLAVTENWADGNTLTAAQLSAAMTSIETWANGNISSDNITSSGVEESNIATGAVTETKLGALSVTLAKLAAEVTAKLVPPGSVTAYVGTSAPTGWLMCDGSAVSRTTYSALYGIISTTHGTGDGSTTFNLPDYRGRFLRGHDDGAGRDPDAASRTAMNTGGNTGDAVGTLQGDAFESHDHGGGAHGHPTILVTEHYDDTPGSDKTYFTVGSGSAITTSGDIIDAEGGNETRPLNATVNYIIKV